MPESQYATRVHFPSPEPMYAQTDPNKPKHFWYVVVCFGGDIFDVTKSEYQARVKKKKAIDVAPNIAVPRLEVAGTTLDFVESSKRIK